jgi:hypothetical protein
VCGGWGFRFSETTPVGAMAHFARAGCVVINLASFSASVAHGRRRMTRQRPSWTAFNAVHQEMTVAFRYCGR